jgi:alginate O-acetyltransferase complex protein AlgI
MVFSSHIFLFWFLPLALAGYYGLVKGPRWARHLFLIAVSYVFYGWANPPFAILLFFTTTVDFLLALWIAREPTPEGGPRSRSQQAALVASLVSNLGLLAYFKYANFAIESYGSLMALLGLEHLAWRDFVRVTLPLGISFYVFHSLSYTIDVYRGHIPATRNCVDFAAFVSLYSQLVAGPIIRYAEVARQLVGRTHTVEKFARGVALFGFGMAKKVLLANPCGKVADTCFDAGSVFALDAWVGLVAYAFQIYFDFSGYSDMAIGLGLMMGFMFPKNFDSPYKSRSITEFWNRWHLSLSTWLRDYLYVPLGGNRHGPRRTYANLMIVMLLGGLWHGAALNFLLWGGIHGLALAFERARGRRSLAAGLPAPLQTAFTFAVVCFAWVFFRAADLDDALRYLGHMFGLVRPEPGAALVGGVIYQPYYLGSLAVAAAITWGAPQAWDFTRRLDAPRAALALLLLWTSCAMLFAQTYNPFIYFMF